VSEGGVIQFTVIGIPQPQGSARAFVPKGWNRAVITGANSKNKPWRQEVSGMADNAMQNLSIVGKPKPVLVKCDFFFDRPKSQKKVLHKTTKPDLDKLLRSVLDAMTGIVFEDDSQVVACEITKGFGQPARVEITVRWPGPGFDDLL